MLRLSAHNLFLLARLVSRMEICRTKPFAEIASETVTNAFLNSAQLLRSTLADSGLSHSAKALDEVIRHLQGHAGEVTYGRLGQDGAILESHLYHELSDRRFFVIEGRHRELFEARDLFGEIVSGGYPSASLDIAEAGRCLALDRFPACLFHLMRVGEKALRVIALELSVPLASIKKGRSWGGVIYDVNEKLAAMDDAAPKKLRLREPMYFLTEVKDLWRDKGIHPVEDFSPERTERVYNSIRSLMQTCVEKGVVEPSDEA